MSLFLLAITAPSLVSVLTYDWHQPEQHVHQLGHDHGHSPEITDECDPCCYLAATLVGITPSPLELLTDHTSPVIITEISLLLSLTRAPPIPPPNIHIV